MAVMGAAGLVPMQPAPAEDPFPIVRTRVTEGNLPDAIKAFDPGVLVRMPRDEFETRVRAAAQLARAARTVPRIAEAHYTAVLTGGDLIGEAEWVIDNSCPGGRVLPLDPLRVALRTATWRDGRSAIIGTGWSGAGVSPGVWVTDSGQQVLKSGWSAVGSGAASDRQFDLRFPPTPVAVLDLVLPADRVPVAAAADVLVTGPFPMTGNGTQRTWRVRFGDRPRVEFAVRGAGEARLQGVVLASLAAQYDLIPGQTACVFEYDLRPTHGSVGGWSFTLSPGLQVTDVVVNNRAGWRMDPATRELRVSLRQQGVGGKILITAVAPLPRGKTAPLPFIRPVGAVIGDERLEVRVHPDLEIESWDSLDYRLTESSVGLDRSRVMNLVGTLLPPGLTEPFRRPPILRVSGSEMEFHTTEAVEWRIEGGRARLLTQVAVRVTRGPLFQVSFRTPPGFTLDRVTGTPDDVVGLGSTAPGGGATVEFLRPVIAGQRVELRLSFRGQSIPSGVPTRLPLPQFATVDAAARDGWVSLCPGPGWSLTPRPSPAAITLAESDDEEPPPPADAAVTYTFRGKEPEGDLVLTPVLPKFTASIQTHPATTAGRGAAVTRIALRVHAGEVPAVTVFEPGRSGRARTWAVAAGSNTVVGATPLALDRFPGLATLLARPGAGFSPIIATGAAFRSEPGTYWVVRFARPVRHEVVLETVATGPGAAAPTPKLAVCGAGAPAPGADPPAAGDALSTTESSQPLIWSLDQLYLITSCSADPVLAVFGGVIVSRGGPSLAILLPAGATVREVCVGGYWLDPGRCQPDRNEGQSELRLPIPAGPDPIRFEVRYNLPGETGVVVRRVTSPLPGLPVPAGIQRWWAFSPDALSVWPFTRVDREPDLPPLLGSAVAGESTMRFPGDIIFVTPNRTATTFGMALATMLAGVIWVGARRAKRRVGFALVVILATTGIAVLLGPAAWVRIALPPLATGLVGFAWMTITRGRSPRAPVGGPFTLPYRTALAAVVGAGFLCSVHLALARAQPRTQDVVFILPGPADAPARETVLAPRSLLDRLDSLGRQSAPGAVITTASYDGRAEEGFARFVVRYTVHSFRDGETPLGLPLADVRLERVTVDGKVAHPAAVRPDLYTVTLPDRGTHDIEVRFVVPIGSSGSDRDVRFGVPEVLDSRIVFNAPAGARQFQAVGRFGDQKIAFATDVARLEAAIGGLRTVQVRWRQGPAGAATMTVREGCVWDVSEAEARLTACYDVRIDSGSVAGFRFELPGDLEPVRIVVRPIAPPTAAVVRDWTVGPEKDGVRPLRIDLTGPADGRALVTLECVSRLAPTRHPVLRFPRPVGMDRKGGVYGLRASGVTIESIGQRIGVIDFAADALFQEFKAVPDLRLNPAVPVLAFSPRLDEVAELRPTLHPSPEPATATQEATWRVGPHRADGEGLIRWSARDPVPILEFALPAARVLEIRGPDVADWSQVDGRVLVWFHKPVKDGAVEWLATSTQAPVGKPPPEPLTFEPPVPQLLHMKAVTRSLRIQPAEGWAGRVERDRGWTPLPSEERGWAFRADGTSPPVRLLLFPPQATQGRGFGLVEVNESSVVYRAIVECPLPAGRPHHLVVRASGLSPGATVSPEFSPGIVWHNRLDTRTEREWDLDIPAAQGSVFRGVVVVRLRAGQGGRLPTVECHTGGAIPELDGVVRWVGMAGVRGVRLAGGVPASPTDLRVVKAQWPGEMQRLGLAGGAIWGIPGAPPVIVFDPPAAPPAPPTRPQVAKSTGTQPAPGATSSRLPLLSAAGWCLAVLVLGVLFAAFPRASWPEQVGLAGALFGVAVAGGVVVGIVVAVIARAGWLLDRTVRVRRIT